MRGRRMVAMTRARTHIWAVGITPLLQPLLAAVQCAFVSLVHGVAATFGMRRSRKLRDWHTRNPSFALPQTKPDTHLETTQPNHAVILGLVPRIPGGQTWGQADSPLETINQDSRDKPENDTVDVETLEACPSARVPGGGRDPASAHRALTARTSVIPAEARQRAELEPRSHAHRRMPPVAYGSRSRASGMTPSMCVQISPV